MAKFVKELKVSIDGIFKVLIWRIDGAITDSEFSQIYAEWLKRRDIYSSPLNVRSQDTLLSLEFLVELA